MLFLFDFDGTIVDSLLPTIDSLNVLSKKYGFAPVKKSEIESIRAKSLKELLLDRHISMLKMPFLIRDILAAQKKNIVSIQLHEGIKETLEYLATHGHHIVVLTSNNEENVRAVFKRNNIHCVKKIYGEAGLFEKEKRIKVVMKEMGVSSQELVYVGDEVRDVEASHAAGIKITAVDWGLNTRGRLEDAGADHIISSAKELIALFL